MEKTQRIVPHLWFDRAARQAAEFYCGVFPESRISSTAVLRGTPSGDTEVVSFEVRGFRLMAISAGPFFKINPSISFFVNFDPTSMKGARERLDEVWSRLLVGGRALMPLDRYPFSEHYGWVQDRYGVSWQLLLADPGGEKRPAVIPSMLFTGPVYGRAEDAIKFYLSVFKGSKMGTITRFGPGQPPAKEGTVMFSDFNLLDTWLAAMDGAGEHSFGFNEAVSFVVNCKDQDEIDYYWERLSAVAESEQCGWLKDRFGISWQVVPSAMADMLAKGTREQIDRVTKAFLPMKKLVLSDLEKAYRGQ